MTDRPGIWPLPPALHEEQKEYRLELSDKYYEARMRIYIAGIRTSAYLLIPNKGQRPDSIPVAAWAQAQDFYKNSKF